MTQDWKVACKDCGKRFYYSGQAAREAEQHGESRPERCVECRAKHNKSTSRMGTAYLDLDPGNRPVEAGELKAGRLGRLDRGPRPHSEAGSAEPEIPEGEFGITDDHVRRLLDLMADHSVVVVEAPTGSGKSTFLPWRLLVPPTPYARDHVTRHGTIVVTQPRIEATQGIPRFIADRLHGARLGAGLDIGYRHSAARDRADSRNRLVYATDGTLLNMIRRGELHTCSVLVIDEAHERSLNIDLILALARRELIALPQLRLLVVSATIDAQSFADFFRPELRVDTLPMPGKEGKPVYERWRAGPALPEAQWPTRMPGEVAETTYEVLRWMASGERPADIPADVPAYDGDILAFLPGKRAITTATEALADLIDDDEDLAGKVEVLPLYAELPQAERTRALRRDRKKKSARWRVIMSTNLAETSLTVEGIRHVVDSGLINSTEWDPATLTTIIRPRPHSRSGLWQRRGRAGRTDPGVWHCLFTREQFSVLPADTPPEITRAPLESVILNAAAAGVSDPVSLRWMPPGPPQAELRRAMAALRGMGAITTVGDPTSLGTELAASRESFSAASLLMCADEAGVAVEAATVLAAVRDRRWVHLLRWGKWPATTRLHADRLHTTILSECVDDLDAVLMLVSQWERLDRDGQERFAARHLLSPQAVRATLADGERLLESLQSRTKTTRVRPIAPGLADRLRKVIAWSAPDSIYRYSGDGEWIPELVPRSDAEVVRRLHDGASPALDSDTLLARREAMPPYLFALVRDRRRRWVSPLQDPADQVTLSFCVALRREHLAADVPLIVHVAGERAGRSPRIPVILPGERMLVEAIGPRAGGVQVRVLAAHSPMPVADIEVEAAADAADDSDSGDLAQREPDSATATADGFGEDASGSAADYLTPEDAEDAADAERPAAREDEAAADLAANAAIRDAIASLDIVASRLDLAHPYVVVRSVTSGMVEADPDPVAVADIFARRYQIGDECTVHVTRVHQLQRDRRRLVLAREQETGAEIVLTGLDLGFGVRDAWFDGLAEGTGIRLAVVAIDVRLGLIQLSALPWTAAVLSRLAQASQEPLSGVIIEAMADRVHVLLTPDEQRLRADDPPVVIEIRADYLPARPAEMEVGQEVRVRLSPRKRSTAEADADLPGLRLPPGPFEWRAGALAVAAPVTARDVLSVYRAARRLGLDGAVALHRALGQLTARALRPRGKVIDVTGLSQMRKGQRVTGAVVAATERGIVVEVAGGTRSSIASEYLAWPGQEEPEVGIGGEVDVHVAEVDPEQGRLLLSLRDPASDPLARLRVGDLAIGQVTRSDEHGLRAWLAEVGVEAFIPARESGMRGEDLADAIPAGSPVQLRLIEVDAVRRSLVASRWIWQERFPLPADLLDVISGDRGPDTRRLRPVLGTSVGLRVDDGVLLLRWTDERPDLSRGECLRRLASLSRGTWVQVEIPHAGPLDVPAREQIATDYGCLLKITRAPGPRGAWSVLLVVPEQASVQGIIDQIAGRYPQLVRGNLRMVTPGPFVDRLRGFRDAERARRAERQPSSQLWQHKPDNCNYVELGEGDSYDAFYQRLFSYSLAFEDAQWAADYRIAVRDSRTVRLPRT